MTEPVPVLYWAPDVYPGLATAGPYGPIRTVFADLTGPDWEAFPLMSGQSRIVSFDSSRGRRSTREDFAAGTLRLVLDGSDGLLDPSVATAHTYQKYAGIPVALMMRDSAGTEHPIFTGLLDSGWNPSWGQGRSRTVECTITDYYGYSAHFDLPGSAANFVCGSQAIGVGTDVARVWWRGPMNGEAATTANNVEVWDFGTSGVNGRLSTGIAAADDPLQNCNLPAFTVAQSSALYRPGTALTMTDPIFGWCQYNIDAAPGADTILIGCRDASTSKKKWMIGMDATGHLFGRVYNSSEALIASVTSSGAYTGTHMVGFVLDVSSRTLDVYTTAGTLSTSWAVPSAGSSGRLVIETAATHGVSFNEWSVGGIAWAFSAVSTMSGAEDVTLNNGTLDANRLDLPPLVARPTDFNSLASKVSTFTPQQSYLKALGDAFGGVVWCRRDGQVVWRAGEDLGYWPSSRGSSDAVDDNVYQVVARLTDAATPGTYTGSVSGDTYPFPIIRYSGDGHGGPDPDRIVNSVEVGNARFIDVASWQRYGPRPQTFYAASGVIAGDPNAVQAQAVADALASPTDSAESVVLQPYGDAAIQAFVLEDLELETRVLLTQSDPVTGAKILNEKPMRVQSEDWSWSRGGEAWTVTISLDQPVPDK